jgi:hypothetical protein
MPPVITCCYCKDDFVSWRLASNIIPMYCKECFEIEYGPIEGEDNND